MEANTIDGGLKLHNLKFFDAAQKIDWLKRYNNTKSKWSVVPYNFDFDGLFKYGVDYIERLLEMTFNPFWLNVLHSLKMFGKMTTYIYLRTYFSLHCGTITHSVYR